MMSSNVASAARNLLILVPITILVVEHIYSGTTITSVVNQVTQASSSTIYETFTVDAHSDRMETSQRRPRFDYQPTSGTGKFLGGWQRNYLTGVRVPLEKILYGDNVTDPAEQFNSCSSNSSGNDDFVWYPSKILPDYNKSLIPRIIHQTTKSQCLTKMVADNCAGWRNFHETWSYALHDDEAMERLVNDLDWPEFPNLKLVWNCLEGRPTQKADLWRYLILWEYGGIYADIDTRPAKFQPDTLDPGKDQGFFAVEQYHLLSQYFMVMAPRHPLMFYSVQACLQCILAVNDMSKMQAPHVTGPHALHEGYIQFRQDSGVQVPRFGKGVSAVQKGFYHGTPGWTIRVEGEPTNEKEWILREALPRSRKRQEYEKMGMSHFMDRDNEMRQQKKKIHKETNSEVVESCLSRLYHVSLLPRTNFSGLQSLLGATWG